MRPSVFGCPDRRSLPFGGRALLRVRSLNPQDGGCCFGTPVRRFFEVHDPTQLDRQGPDVGSQYRSAVFWLDESQKRTAQKLMDELRGLGYDVVTRLEKAGAFYEAEAYHQDFARRTGRGGCHLAVPRFERRADGSPR